MTAVGANVAAITSNEVKIITTVIPAVVWPVIVLVLVLAFKAPITKLLDRLKTLKGPGGLQAAFGEQAVKVQQAADKVSGEITDDTTTTLLVALAGALPWPAVRQAWQRIRVAARAASGGSAGDGISTPKRVEELLSQGRVEPEVYDLTKQLTSMYFAMRGAPTDVTPDSASTFVESSSKLVTALGNARPAGIDLQVNK